MPIARVRVSVTSPLSLADQIRDLLSDLNRELKREARKLATDAQRDWRRATPKITGLLRKSERVIPFAGRGAIGIVAKVVPLGSLYYDSVASRPEYSNRRLKNLKRVRTYLNRHGPRRVDRALRNAGFR